MICVRAIPAGLGIGETMLTPKQNSLFYYQQFSTLPRDLSLLISFFNFLTYFSRHELRLWMKLCSSEVILMRHCQNPEMRRITLRESSGQKHGLSVELHALSFDASSHLYVRVCPSVRPSVCPSVCPQPVLFRCTGRTL